MAQPATGQLPATLVFDYPTVGELVDKGEVVGLGWLGWVGLGCVVCGRGWISGYGFLGFWLAGPAELKGWISWGWGNGLFFWGR